MIVARVVDDTGEHVTLHLRGHGAPGSRPLLGQLIVRNGEEADELLFALAKGGIEIIDPHAAFPMLTEING